VSMRPDTLLPRDDEEVPQPDPQAPALPVPFKPLPLAIAELEGVAIREALRLTGGNKMATARLLGISRAALYDKLGRHGLGTGLS
jgi:DNA-binding NtrC family response regulator